MKKLAVALMTSAVVLFGFGAAASAQYDNSGTTAPPVVTPTPPVVVETTNTEVETSDAQSPPVVVETTNTEAQTTQATSEVASQGVVSQAGGLPATGSSGMSTTTGIALGLLAVGLGLLIVTRVRRRNPAAG